MFSVSANGVLVYESAFNGEAMAALLQMLEASAPGVALIEVLPSGRVNLKGTPYLAGSGMILPLGIENAVRFAGVSLAESVQMATANPARLLGLEDRIGAVAPGKEATLTLFRWNAETSSLAIEGVVLRGQLIRAAEMGDALKPAGDQVF